MQLSSHHFRDRLRRLVWPVVALAITLLVWSAWRFAVPSAQSLGGDPGSARRHDAEVQPAGPPWLYGRPDARFTVVEYADLECPGCRAYTPVLQRWIVSVWQFHLDEGLPRAIAAV
jgi:hypothetical protein